VAIAAVAVAVVAAAAAGRHGERMRFVGVDRHRTPAEFIGLTIEGARRRLR